MAAQQLLMLHMADLAGLTANLASVKQQWSAPCPPDLHVAVLPKACQHTVPALLRDLHRLGAAAPGQFKDKAGVAGWCLAAVFTVPGAAVAAKHTTAESALAAAPRSLNSQTWHCCRCTVPSSPAAAAVRPPALPAGPPAQQSACQQRPSTARQTPLPHGGCVPSQQWRPHDPASLPQSDSADTYAG